MPKPLHVVFPEGFTRADMADRVAAVAKIAEAVIEDGLVEHQLLKFT